MHVAVKDHTLLATLRDQAGISNRQLAKAAGYRSHSYMNRLTNGDATTLQVKAAAGISEALGVTFDVLFAPTVDGKSGRNGRKERAA